MTGAPVLASGGSGPRLGEACRTLALAAALLASTACVGAPTARNNPLDRDSDVTLRIVGVPDTIFSFLETITVSLESDVPLPAGAQIIWTSDRLTEIAPGTMRPHSAGFAPLTGTLRATLGPTRNPRIVEHRVVVRQRPRIAVMSCVPSCHLQSYFQDVAILVELQDSLGTPLSGPTFGGPLSQYLVRDTTVVALRYDVSGPVGSGLRTRADGESWVVFRGGDAFSVVDSVLITVQQVAVAADVHCPETMYVGQTAQITVARWKDARGATYAGDAPTLIWDAGGPSNPLDPQGVDVTVTPDGSVTAHAPGVWYTTATMEGRGEEIAADCRIWVSW